MRAYDSGEISTALSKLEKILELEASTPVFVIPGHDQVYRETYNRVRSEWEAVQHAIAEVERVIAAGNLARAAEIAQDQSIHIRMTLRSRHLGSRWKTCYARRSLPTWQT